MRQGDTVRRRLPMESVPLHDTRKTLAFAIRSGVDELPFLKPASSYDLPNAKQPVLVSNFELHKVSLGTDRVLCVMAE